MRASGVWMRSRGWKGPPSSQPHKGPMCQAHDEQGAYPAVHPPHRELYPWHFYQFFGSVDSKHWRVSKRGRKKKEMVCEATGAWAWMKVTRISVPLLFTARCPIAWLEHSLIWEKESERAIETGRAKEWNAEKHKKASLWLNTEDSVIHATSQLLRWTEIKTCGKITYFLIVTPINYLFHINEYNMSTELNQKMVKRIYA